ncbi:MAG: hypothetical protein H7A33_04595 [Deltaproteobacteria bacterium]|nr:hypothetical protein [Deltaproteobacteria bacterium]
MQFFTPVFFEHLPADLSFEYSAAVQADQAAQDFFKKIEIILTETNKAFHGLPTVALKDNQCFIYNIDHSVVLEGIKTKVLENKGCHIGRAIDDRFNQKSFSRATSTGSWYGYRDSGARFANLSVFKKSSPSICTFVSCGCAS